MMQVIGEGSHFVEIHLCPLIKGMIVTLGILIGYQGKPEPCWTYYQAHTPYRVCNRQQLIVKNQTMTTHQTFRKLVIGSVGVGSAA